MPNYVDGFVIPVPTRKLADYRRLAQRMGKLWIEHGALAVHECAGDDVKRGKVTSFPQAVKLKAGETVVFSWIVYRSRRHRDQVNARVMNDPRIAAAMAGPMPFDTTRMFFGGFRQIVGL